MNNPALPADGVLVRTIEKDAQIQVVALDVGGTGPESILSSANPMPTSDVSLKELQGSILALTETMTYLLSAMLEKMPRLDPADRLIARVVTNGENDLTSPYGGIFVNGVGNPSTGVQFMRTFEPWNFSDAGAARIYQQIQVTA